MLDDNDDGARVGLWVTLGVVTLLLFGLVGGLATRQMHKAHAGTKPAAAMADADATLDAPLSGEMVGRLFFESASVALPAETPVAVSAAAAALAKAAPESRLVLSGFHDATGDAAKNAELAKARAKAVRSALLAAGVDAMRVALRKPESTTGEGKPEEARRVEIRLVP